MGYHHCGLSYRFISLNAADYLQWSTISCAAGAVWGSLWSVLVVHSVHSWAGPHRRLSSTQSAPVCWWHAGLHQHIGRWRWGSRQTSHSVSCRRRRLAEGQLTPTEPHRDPHDVVGYPTAAGESQHARGSGGVCTYQRLRDAVCIGSQRVSQWLLPAMAAPTARQVDVIWRRQDAGPAVFFHVAWTTATHCSTASRMVWWAGCSLFRMRLHVWCQALNAMTA